MESIALEDKSAFKGFGDAQETLRTAIQKGNEGEIKEKLDKFSGVLSEVSAHLEEKGLDGLKAFVEHTKFIVDMAAENEKEKAPTQIDEGKKWLFMNGFPASIKSIEPLNKEPYTAAEYNSFINELGFGVLWSALQGRIDAENRLNAGVSDAAEAEKLRMILLRQIKASSRQIKRSVRISQMMIKANLPKCLMAWSFLTIKSRVCSRSRTRC